MRGQCQAEDPNFRKLRENIEGIRWKSNICHFSREKVDPYRSNASIKIGRSNDSFLPLKFKLTQSLASKQV